MTNTVPAGLTFWHLTTTDNFLLNNARLGKGWTASVSYFVEMEGNDGFVTPYSMLHRDKDKEAVWEAVRQQKFPKLPSRMKALYAFLTQTDAESALSLGGWFEEESRVIIAVQPSPNAVVHVADAGWLDSRADHWTASASEYWSGAKTDDPKPEVVLHGQFYCPGWREPPFGLLGSPSVYRES